VAGLAIDEAAMAERDVRPHLGAVMAIGALPVVVVGGGVAHVAGLAIDEFLVAKGYIGPRLNTIVAVGALFIVVIGRGIIAMAGAAVLGETGVIDVAPTVGIVAIGTLAAGRDVFLGADMTGVALGIGIVIKSDVIPGLCTRMAVGALTWPMPSWSFVACRAVISSHVIETNLFPVSGAVTIGALSNIVLLLRRDVAGLAIHETAMIERDDVPRPRAGVAVGALAVVVFFWCVIAVARLAVHQATVVENYGAPRRRAGVAIGALTAVMCFGGITAVTRLAIHQVGMVENSVVPALGRVAVGALGFIMVLGSVIGVARAAVAASAVVADAGPVASAMTIGALAFLVPLGCGVTHFAVH
jgi:hypothetical protein